MTTYYYSADLLSARDACSGWVAQFREVFGNSDVPLTAEFCEKLLAHKFPVRWPAFELWWRTTYPRRDNEIYQVYKSLCPAAKPTSSEVYRCLTRASELWAEYHRGRK